MWPTHVNNAALQAHWWCGGNDGHHSYHCPLSRIWGYILWGSPPILSIITHNPTVVQYIRWCVICRIWSHISLNCVCLLLLFKLALCDTILPIHQKLAAFVCVCGNGWKWPAAHLCTRRFLNEKALWKSSGEEIIQERFSSTFSSSCVSLIKYRNQSSRLESRNTSLGIGHTRCAYPGAQSSRDLTNRVPER